MRFHIREMGKQSCLTDKKKVQKVYNTDLCQRNFWNFSSKLALKKGYFLNTYFLGCRLRM